MYKGGKNMKRFCILLTPELAEELKKEAKQTGVSLSSYIRIILLGRNK